MKMTATAIKAPHSKDTYLWNAVAKFREHKLAVLGLAVLVLEIALVVGLPWVMKLDPFSSDFRAVNAAPGAQYMLGTDSLGRDVLARLMHGGRTSLIIGLFSSLIGLVVGVPAGLLAGYYRGWVETVVMRIADIFMSFPGMVLILVLVAVMGTNIWSVTMVIGVLGWTQYARLVYAKVLSVRETEYVESARAIGTRDLGIIMKYVLPNSVAPILIQFTFRTAQAMIMESSLSFLGMGVRPPNATWGNMMYDAQSISVLANRLWLWLPPGLALVLTIVSINAVGDGIRDALDPKTKI